MATFFHNNKNVPSMRHCEEGTARRGNLPLCVECNIIDLFIIHIGGLPRSYFGTSKYSLAMTYNEFYTQKKGCPLGQPFL